MSLLNRGKTDPNKILPVVYPFARECYKLGVANNWFPEEVPMQDDIEMWKSDALTDLERRLILWNMGFFSTAESLTANNIVLAVYQHVTDPNCRAYLLRQAFEEAIHSDTFVYCCDSLGLDPDEVYSMYENIPSIKLKDSFVINLTKSISDKSFSIPPLKDKPEGDLTEWLVYKAHRDEQVRAFLKDLIGYYVIMEGIFFYAGFAMMLALKRQKKMTGIGEQFDFIMRDECLSKDTELLTHGGWKAVTDITYDTEIAQWNRDGTINFTKPKKLSKSNVSKLYLFKNDQNHVNQLVSENHRIVYLTKDNNLKIICAKDAAPNVYCKFINCGTLAGGVKNKLSPEERFLIALQADGEIPDPVLRDGSICEHRTCKFIFAKKRKTNRLKEIVNELGWDFKEVSYNNKNEIRVKVPFSITVNKNFFSWVNFNDVTSDWCKYFVDEISYWDGHRVEGEGDRINYRSVVEKNVDIVQAIATLAGYRTCKVPVDDDRSENFSRHYELHIFRNINNTSGGTIKKSEQCVEDTVYGIEVESTFILIRREGAVSVTGNSVHLAFGMDLINTIRAEEPDAWTKELEVEVLNLILQAVELEKAYAYDACPQGLVGINAKQFCNYVEYVADRRLERLGMGKHFETSNPFPWMSQSTDLVKEKNFFETTVTEYQTGSLKWE